VAETDPVYQSRSYTKNGKHYWLKEVAWIFDCPHCETARDHFSRENAITHMDMHFMKVHPEAHIPLCPADVKEKVGKWFRDFQLRSHAPLGTLREPMKFSNGTEIERPIVIDDPEYRELLAEELEREKEYAKRN
jgi:hypothetical protein